MSSIAAEAGSKTPARTRRAKQKSRIAKSIHENLSHLPRVTVLRADDYFEAVLRTFSRTPPTLASCQLILNNIPLTVVGVPDRVWSNDVSMAPIKRAVQQMFDVGRMCVLLPYSGISAVRRLDASLQQGDVRSTALQA